MILYVICTSLYRKCIVIQNLNSLCSILNMKYKVLLSVAHTCIGPSRISDCMNNFHDKS